MKDYLVDLNEIETLLRKDKKQAIERAGTSLIYKQARGKKANVLTPISRADPMKATGQSAKTAFDAQEDIKEVFGQKEEPNASSVFEEEGVSLSRIP